MTAITEEVKWTTESMIEVGLREPDDFLKVRETLTRICLLYTSPSPRDRVRSRMPSSA